MVGAQLEDGYTRIANEILEHIAKIDLCGSQRRIIDIIWRYTYGFKRKEHEFSNNFLAKATNMDKKYCREQLKKLIDKRIILVIKEGTYSSSKVLAFNKHFEQWHGYFPLGNEYPPGEDLPPREEIHPTPGEENYPTSGEYTHPTPGVDIPPQERKLKDNLKENFKESTEDEEEKQKSIYDYFTHYGFGTLSGGMAEQLAILVKDYSEEWVRMALEKGMIHGARNLAYVISILQGWKSNGGPRAPSNKNNSKKGADKRERYPPGNARKSRGERQENSGSYGDLIGY